MSLNVGLFSYGTAALAFLMLLVLLLVSSRNTPIVRRLCLACLLSCGWAALSALNSTAIEVPGLILYMVEFLRQGGWLIFLSAVLSHESDESLDPNGTIDTDGAHRLPGHVVSDATTLWRSPFVLAILSVMLVGLMAPALLPYLRLEAFGLEISATLWLGGSIFGLMLVEQLLRRARHVSRVRFMPLCIGLGGLFAYDFLMFSDALLFKQLDPEFWDARGVVNAILVPFIAVSAARNATWEASLHVSREALTHSVTLAGSAIYLILMAAAGIAIRQTGAQWSEVVLIGFSVASLLVLLLLLSSSRLRSKLARLLSEHFYSSRYNYRQVWLGLTRTLSESDQAVSQRIVTGLTELVRSPGAVLWALDREGVLRRVASRGTMDNEVIERTDVDALLQHFRQSPTLVNLDALRDELSDAPQSGSSPILSAALLENLNAWVALPLCFRDEPLGIVLLARSGVIRSINWEDRDLLDTAGYQCAAVLAQTLAADELLEARQFEGFHKLSTYIVHDLKNILSQQGLIVANAPQHRDNPEFVDDVINTVENSVERMHRLMRQLRSGSRDGVLEPFELVELLQQSIDDCRGRQPEIEFHHDIDGLQIEADKLRLRQVFVHLLQNAQDATPAEGRVRLDATRAADHLRIVVTDTGRGMDAHFIEHRLFKPFDSTKGLTGMGIGAFESREFILSLGGELTVHSEPGQGSRFIVSLPLSSQGLPANVAAAEIDSNQPRHAHG